VSAPTLSERLVVLAARHRKAERDMRDRQQNSLAAFEGDAAEVMEESALELARLESQLEAAGLGKPAYHQPPYVDGYFGER
jgi:hypothetical protein